jgi:NADPH:quinone reductase-like Zn-dependent oxidoreductase
MPTRYVLEAGNLADMKLQPFELAEPQPEEVQVAVRAIGLNFADVFAIWGLYGATPQGAFTPGLEYAGEVIKTGKFITHLKPGDKVMGVTRFGAYTSHLNIDGRYAMPLPSNWDFATGAAYLVQTLTAYYGMVHLGALQKGQTVLIHSAVGGVGLQALKIAEAYGCYTIGTVGTEQKVAFAKKEGYHEVIVRGKKLWRGVRWNWSWTALAGHFSAFRSTCWHPWGVWLYLDRRVMRSRAINPTNCTCLSTGSPVRK